MKKSPLTLKRAKHDISYLPHYYHLLGIRLLIRSTENSLIKSIKLFYGHVIRKTSIYTLLRLQMAISGIGFCTQFVAQGVVIDEFFGGGGNNGAPYNRDFILIKNITDQSKNIAGWTLQYASATGNFNSQVALSGWIDPGEIIRVCYYTGTNGSPLPFSCDFTSPTNLSANNGKLALSTTNDQVNSTPGNVLPGTGNFEALADFLGYGSANQFETEAAPAGSALYGLKRWQETNNNVQDFSPLAPLPLDFTIDDAHIDAKGSAIVHMELFNMDSEISVSVNRSQDGIFFHPVNLSPDIWKDGTSKHIKVVDQAPLPGLSFYKLSIMNDQFTTENEFLVKCLNPHSKRLPSSILTCKENCILATGSTFPSDVFLYDMNGYPVRHFPDCLESISFETSDLRRGTYILRLKSQDSEKICMLLLL